MKKRKKEGKKEKPKRAFRLSRWSVSSVSAGLENRLAERARDFGTCEIICEQEKNWSELCSEKSNPHKTHRLCPPFLFPEAF